ncbi:MAG: hypothetical protein IPI17_10575 [Nitrosomonas sp.]|jgi:hypothetical protein|nr:hypothetical protein [Nitrosomonas sp.]
MSTEHEKSIRELEVFASFVSLSPIAIVPGSTIKRTPPEPDLLCQTHEGEIVAFELVELCDPQIAKVFSNPLAFGSEYIRTSDPSRFIIQKKLTRSYITEHPVELLCYTDGRIGTPPNLIIPTLKQRISNARHNFRRAWLLSRGSVHKLWDEV